MAANWRGCDVAFASRNPTALSLALVGQDLAVGQPGRIIDADMQRR
jgi:hypothetical protein